jgi:hypothetical protein
MKKKVIIDFLNLASFIYLIINARNSSVIALFKSKSTKLEFILIKLLKLFKINYFFEEMKFANLPQNPISQVIEKNKEFTKLITNQFNLNSSSKINDFYNFSINSWIFHHVWRLVSINEYVQSYYQNVKIVYIAAPVNKNILNKQFRESNCLTNQHKIKFYYGFGSINDDQYAYRSYEPQIKFFGKKISSFIYLIYLLLFTPIKIRQKKDRTDALIFSHDQVVHKWLGVKKIQEYLNLKSNIIIQSELIDDNEKRLKIFTLHWSKVGNFYLHNLKGFFKFLWALKLNINLFSSLIQSWRYIFFLENIFKELDVKIVFSGGIETSISRIAVALASDRKDIISFDSTSSLGEYPTEFSGSWHKFADRFFIWGSWHHHLSVASKDRSAGHIISGYIYDDRISKMKKKGVTFRKNYSNKFKKIITIFDTTIDNDHSFSGNIILRYIDTIVKVAIDLDALVVLKTKKNNTEYEALIKSYENDRMVIHDEYGSLVAALESDVVVGLSSSTPAAIASLYEKNVLMFEPTKIVWNKWNDDHPFSMLHSLDELESNIRQLLIGLDYQKRFNVDKFDPFADGKSLYRIAKYIDCSFDNLHLGKNKALYFSDKQYVKEWGRDKVILN